MATTRNVLLELAIASVCICAAACGSEPDDLGSDSQAQASLRATDRPPPDEPPSSTEQAIAVAAASDPGELIPLFIGLEDPEFDFRRLRDAEGGAREAVIDERKLQLAEAHAPVIQRLTELGGVLEGTFWVVPTIVARIPAQFVATVATWSEVTAIQYNDPNLVATPDEASDPTSDY